MENLIERLEAESLEEYLWRLGSLKKKKHVDLTWNDICICCNENFNLNHDESFYRKKYKKLMAAFRVPELQETWDSDLEEKTRQTIREIEKQKILVQDQKNYYRKTMRQEARQEQFHLDFLDAVKAAEPKNLTVQLEDRNHQKVLYVLLSDIHYGLNFNNIFSEYNEDIAAERIEKYMNAIIQAGRDHHIAECYVSLLGDLISGNIHPTIKMENKEDVIQQVINVSELISSFLIGLSENFETVFVNNVSGNHSRLDGNPDNVSRGERLDLLIPWYCEAKLAKYNNVQFISDLDKTLAAFPILGKIYVAVHGDFDQDLKTSAVRLSSALNMKVDYIVAGHTHVPAMEFDSTSLIRNGAVVSSGDEYTVKKRLFGPAYQVMMICSDNGVDAVYPVKL